MELTKDQTVYDIIGAFGPYQWSATLFALFCSTLAGIMVVVGPLWTPEMRFVCNSDQAELRLNRLRVGSTDSSYQALDECLNFTLSKPANYSTLISSTANQSWLVEPESCSSFLYDDYKSGQMLTNTVSSNFHIVSCV